MKGMRPALGALLITLASCVAPPVLIRATDLDRESVQGSLAERAQRVERILDDGTHLVGWYVPAEEGAPLVLSLLESGAAVDSKRSSRALLTRQLADLGFASLVLDYTGVGASSGRRSARHLARDARAMWAEALERVDGDPRRVVLRGTSLGTLAALTLIEDGAQPAGVILLVPVMPDTVTGRFARAFYGRALGWLASGLFGDVVDLDPVEVIDGAPLHWLLVQGERDQLTSPAERAALGGAIERQGGSVEWLAYDHLVASVALLGLSPGELAFLTDTVPGVRDGEARWARFEARRAATPYTLRPADEAQAARLREIVELAYDDDPWRLHAAAVSGADPLTATRVRWALAARPGTVFDPAGLVALADLDDPAGPLPLDVFTEVASIQDLLARASPHYMAFNVETIAALASGAGSDEEPARFEVTVGLDGGVSTTHLVDFSVLLKRLRARGLGDADARRQLARMLLKANRIPDRVATLPGGGLRLEFRRDGNWEPLDLDPETVKARVAAGTQGWIRLQAAAPIARP